MMSSMDWLNIAVGIFNTFGVALLGLLHVKNASAIASTVGQAAVAASSDAAALAHGQWETAIPDIIAQALQVAQTVAPGEMAKIGLPTGDLVVHVGNGQKLTPIGMTPSPLANATGLETGVGGMVGAMAMGAAQNTPQKSPTNSTAQGSQRNGPPLVRGLRQVSG